MTDPLNAKALKNDLDKTEKALKKEHRQEIQAGKNLNKPKSKRKRSKT